MSKKNKTWTEKELKFLYTMREDGIPYRLISVELKRSIRACERKFQTTDWVSSAFYDPTKARMNTRMKQVFIEKTARLQDRKHNTNRMIGEIVGDKMARAISALPNIPKMTYKGISKKQKKHSDEDVGLILSDCHIGLHHTLEETGGISEYNVDVFKDRVENLKMAVKDIVELHSKLYALPKLHIFALGDIVAGMNSSGAWSPTYINLTIYDQVIVGIDALSDMIYYWLGLFDEIHFYGIVGNHGRAAPAGVEKEYVNWDLICYKFLQARFGDNDRIKFHIPLSWWSLEEIRKHKFLMVHGDEVKGSMKKLIDTEEKMTGILKQIPDYTLAAHFHNIAEFTTNHGKVIFNGSFVGSDIYSLKDLQKSSPPEQKVFGIHDKRGITWTYNLNLDIKR